MLRPCLRRLSASSARPLLAAEPRRSMFNDDGGVGTIVSSRVRLTRSSWGCFVTTAACLAGFFGAFADRLAAGFRAGLAARRGFAARAAFLRTGPRVRVRRAGRAVLR